MSSIYNLFLSWFLQNVDAICNLQFKVSICSLLIIIVYKIKTIILKVLVWIRRLTIDDMFEDCYDAVAGNDTVKAICILDNNPRYANKYNISTGYTPFMIACTNVNTQLVTYMLRRGADPNKMSKHGETPFYLASFYYIRHKKWKNASCIRELYYAGANVNKPGRNGVHVIQMAAVFGHTPLVKWLVSKNADLNVCPHPYLLAQSHGHHATASLIATNMKIKYLPY